MLIHKLSVKLRPDFLPLFYMFSTHLADIFSENDFSKIRI